MTIYSIYRVTNTITSKVYIGFTSQCVGKRIIQHIYDSNRRTSKFYNSISKHGWQNFSWEIIYQSLDGEHTKNVMESHFIKEFDSYDNGYNSTFGGDGVDSVTASIISSTPNAKKIRSLNSTKRWADLEYRKKAIESMRKAQDNPIVREKKSKRMSLENKLPYRVVLNREVNLGANSYNYDHTIYHFKHKDGREEHLTQNEMRKKHNLQQANLSATIKGRQKSIGGWVIIKC